MSTPREELFEDLSDQLENLEQPLNLAWMKARNVSLEELQAVSQKAALILRGYLALSPAQRIAFVQQGIFNAVPDKNQRGENENHDSKTTNEVPN